MRILIVRNNHNEKALEASFLLDAYLASQNIECRICDSDDIRYYKSVEKTVIEDIDSFNLAVVLGGDGTLLGTAAEIGYHRIPILGINFGNLGFMVNSNEDGVVSLVAAALAGELVVEKRTNLCIDVYCEETEEPGAKFGPTGPVDFNDELPETPTARLFALNEMALSRGSQGRIIDFSYAIDGCKMADLRGDGLVISTATGSTAYALSLGGPLVAPNYHGIILVPIAPHTLQSRAVMTNPSDVIEVGLGSSLGNRQATMFIDGELIEFEKPIRRVVVRTGEEPTILLRSQKENFYNMAANTFFK